MSIESVMPSSHLILCCPLLLLPSIFPSIRVFSNESARHIRWPKYWSFSFSISPSDEHPGLISFRMDWLDLLAVQGSWVSNSTVQKHQFFGAQLCSRYQLSLAAVTNRHKLSTNSLYSYRLRVRQGSQWTKIKVSAGLHSCLEPPGKNPFPCFFQLLEAACLPWLLGPFLQLQESAEAI